MDLNTPRERFNKAIREQLAAIEATMDVFNDTMDRVDTRLHELQENDAELKRLILEQGEEIKALRERLNGK